MPTYSFCTAIGLVFLCSHAICLKVSASLLTALPRAPGNRQILSRNSSSSENKTEYYFETSSPDVLGFLNPAAAAGNPLKGLVAYPEFSNFDSNATSIDASLEAYYIGLDELMQGDPLVVGSANAFNWTALESRLSSASSRHRHAILTIMCHYPNWYRLSVPQYILDAGLVLHDYPDFLGGGKSPDYGDPLLMTALQQFVYAFGKKYDGDARIGFINLGLLGFWGEWHTFPHDFVPETSKISLVQWYTEAFNTTKLQARYPFEPAYKAGFGLVDSSFTYETLNGDANGGVTEGTHYYFWPSVVAAGQTNFWRVAPMGGETRPEQQPMVFEPWYAAGTFMKQDFTRCVRTTHASFMYVPFFQNCYVFIFCLTFNNFSRSDWSSGHQDAFVHGGYQGEKLSNALHAHTTMGYNFLISKIALAATSVPGTIVAHTVQLDVTVNQVGVAPFYYPLSLVFDCPDLINSLEQKGMEGIIAEGDSKLFSFHGIPATSSCLSAASLHMYSSFAYTKRPIKFAQGVNGTVLLNLSLPPDHFLSNSNTTTNIPSISPSIDRSLLPSMVQKLVIPELPTSLTYVPTSSDTFIATQPSLAPSTTQILPNVSDNRTIGDMHAFNTHFTPSLMKLEAERKQRKLRSQNLAIVATVGSSLALLCAAILVWRRRRRRLLAHNMRHPDRLSNRSVRKPTETSDAPRGNDRTVASGSSDGESSVAEA